MYPLREVVPAMEPERFGFTVLGTMFGPGCMLERARLLAGERWARVPKHNPSVRAARSRSSGVNSKRSQASGG